MASNRRVQKSNALVCEERAEAANDPGVKKAYQRAAAQWHALANRRRGEAQEPKCGWQAHSR
jgi:hypothetical protein